MKKLKHYCGGGIVKSQKYKDVWFCVKCGITWAYYPSEPERIKTMKRTYFNELGRIAADGLSKDMPDFRKSGEQIIYFPFDGKQTVKYVGKCPVTGVRLYESTGSNDPRGPLGVHAVTDFIASEHGMEGPTMAASWIACNNDRATYEKALEIAKRNWKAIE